MRYRVSHGTTYHSEERVSLCHNVAWLTPRDTSHQTCEHHELTIDPLPSVRSDRTDSFGNATNHFSFNEGFQTLQVTSVSHVTVNEPPRVDPADSPAWDALRDRLHHSPFSEDFPALRFVFRSPRIPCDTVFSEYASQSLKPGRPLLEGLLDLTSRINREFEYDARATTVSTPVMDVLQHRRGVCQDFAHLEIAMLRSLGLAARYVSGYLRTIPAPGRSPLVGADASHAWLSVFCGECGWIDVDPTNDKLVGEEYITLAWGRDYSDVSPLKGVYVGGQFHSMSVAVDVTPVLTNGHAEA